MTTDQSESYEAYCARREREIFEERLAIGKAQKERNYAVLRSKFSRFGVMQPMPRTQEEIEVIAKSEREILGSDVSGSILNTVKADVVAALPEELNTSIAIEKQPEIDENSVVIGHKSPISERVDCRDYFDIAKPCVVEDQLCVVAITNYLGKCVVKTERDIINSMRSTQPFKDYVGSKSDLIKKTLSDMVIQGLLCSTLVDEKANYSLVV